MKDEILAVVVMTLKQIKSDLTIYLDSVMQSDKELYSVLSIEEAGTENIGKNIQNKAWLVDIAFVDNVMNNQSKKEMDALTVNCGAFFNALEIDGNEIYPEDYQVYETDGVPHVTFNVAFPQIIEWSEE
jgi:hypothetical protein